MGTACEPPSPPPLFPESYRAIYEEVRGCRRSADHDLEYIRVLVPPEVKAAYLSREAPFPVGTLIVKEQYADSLCTDLAGFTAMRRAEAGYAPMGGDWFWQRLEADRRVLEQGRIARCTTCHRACAEAPGHDWTCAEP